MQTFDRPDSLAEDARVAPRVVRGIAVRAADGGRATRPALRGAALHCRVGRIYPVPAVTEAGPDRAA
jgi:hypothetical protein